MIKSNAIIEINTKNIIHNYNAINHISNKSVTAATIKANAYGLGVLKIFDLLYKNNCRHFFVATLEESLKIRKYRKHGNIYVLNGLENNDFTIFFKNKIIPILNSIKEIHIFIHNKFYEKNNKIGVQVDTGLNRLGIKIKDLLQLKKKINLYILISHLSSADEKKNPYNKLQNKRFKRYFKKFKQVGYKSLANSMGSILGNDYHYDLIRPGISLYGGHFFTKMQYIIKPVIILKAKVLQIKKINTKEFIGYNQTYLSKKKIKVAILGIGYADGLSRVLSNRGNVYFNDKKFKIIGRVSMDTITVDITNNDKDIEEGNYLEIINYQYGIDAIAKESHTICDEILTSISNRVKKIYI